MNPEALSPASQGAALQLRDIHLPEPVSWWPVAPGWWALLALLIIAVVMFTVLRKVNRRRRLDRLVRDEIEHELETIKQHYQDNANAVMLARELSQLLRRAGISYYPANDVAGLIGDDWLNFLARTLLIAPYLDDSAQIELDGEQLIALCESWLLQKHVHKLGFSNRIDKNKHQNIDQPVDEAVSKTRYGRQQVSAS